MHANDTTSDRKARSALLAAARAVVVLSWGSLATSACGTVHHDGPEFGGISGTVIYAGTKHEEIEQVALLVLAFGFWPPENLPHASVTIVDPKFEDGGKLAYRLDRLDPYDYVVLAALIDLNEPLSLESGLSGDSAPPAVGAHPSLATVFSGEPRVTVRAGEITEGIDVPLSDL